MHHVHRQILALEGWRPLVITQKIENLGTFPVDDLAVIPRSPARFLGRALEKHLTGAPWQISRGETRRIRAVLRERGARALHVFFGNVAVHLLPLIESVDLPVVVSFHGADVAGAIASEKYRAARARVFARAARVACRSEALAAEVRKMGCPPEKLTVIRTALPDLEFRARSLPADGAIRLFQAGRLVPKKGLATSLAAFARLAARFPRMTFEIAGAGSLEAELRGKAAGLGVADRVTFSGFLDQAALRERLAAAHVFLHPSETVNGDVEGIPNGLLEAMATGLPVVATRHGGIPEAVEDGVSGMLCAERDAEGLAAAVTELVTDPERYARVAQAGAESVREKFSRAAIGAQLRALYDSVTTA